MTLPTFRVRYSSPMGSTGISAVKTAYTALNAGDPEPLAGLFGADTVWRGIEHGFLWWRRAPS